MGTMKILLAFALLSFAVHAQAKLCTDENGRKVYTDAACGNPGMKAAGAAKDTRSMSPRCQNLADEVQKKRENAARARAKGGYGSEATAIILEGDANRTERIYRKDCRG